MSTQRHVTVRDLVEEAKKRIVFLVICVVGLSYLISLTSSSVLVNLPAAVSLIILLRYFSLDYEMRRKAAAYSSKPSSASTLSQNNTSEYTRVLERPNWRGKVNSPVVEDAIDHFTRHLISEWVTDLWYSRLTPDRQGPEELVQIMNGALGDFSSRMRNINLVDLLTRMAEILLTSFAPTWSFFEIVKQTLKNIRLDCSLLNSETRSCDLSWLPKTDFTLLYFLLKQNTRFCSM